MELLPPSDFWFGLSLGLFVLAALDFGPRLIRWLFRTLPHLRIALFDERRAALVKKDDPA